MAEFTERRAEARIAWKGNLRLEVAGGAAIPAAIRDISTNGFGLWIDQPLAPGVAVVVLGEGFRGEGTVQYCEAQGQRYRIGLLLHGAIVS